MSLHIYGDPRSGNCLKVKWTADLLGLRYDWTDVDVLSGKTRTSEFLAINDAGQVPAVVLENGRHLAESNAIMLYLADGSNLIPSDSFARAKMFQWLFWEQYSHEPYVAVARFQVQFLKKPAAALDAKLVERGNAALDRLENTLAAGGPFLLGSDFSLADIALVAYSRWADEGGFDLLERDHLRAWIARVEQKLSL